MNFLCLGGILIALQLSWSWWWSFLVKAVGFGVCILGLGELEELCRIQADNCDARTDRPSVRGFGGIRLGRTVKTILGGTPEQNGHRALQENRLRAIGLIRNSSVLSLAVSAAGAGWLGVLGLIWKPEKLVSVGDDGKSITRVAYNAFGMGGTVELVSSTVIGIITTLLAIRVLAGMMSLLYGNDSRNIMRTLHDGTAKKDKRMHFTLDRLEVGRLCSSEFTVSLCMIVNMVCDTMNRVVPWESAQSFFGFLAALSKLTLYVFVIIMANNFNHVRVSCNKKYDSEYPGKTTSRDEG